MNALQNDTRGDVLCANKHADETTQTSVAIQSLRLLTPLEVGTVAGGPEADVSSGVTPH